MNKVINIAGYTSKSHLTLALAYDLLKYGSTLLISDNKEYIYFTDNFDSEYNLNGVDIQYIDKIKDILEVVDNSNYANILIDTYAIIKSPKITDYVEIYTDIDMSARRKFQSKKSFKIGYLEELESLPGLDLLLPVDYNHKIVFSTREKSSGDKDLFVREVISSIYPVDKRGYKA